MELDRETSMDCLPNHGTLRGTYVGRRKAGSTVDKIWTVGILASCQPEDSVASNMQVSPQPTKPFTVPGSTQGMCILCAGEGDNEIFPPSEPSLTWYWNSTSSSSSFSLLSWCYGTWPHTSSVTLSSITLCGRHWLTTCFWHLSWPVWGFLAVVRHSFRCRFDMALDSSRDQPRSFNVAGIIIYTVLWLLYIVVSVAEFLFNKTCYQLYTRDV